MKALRKPPAQPRPRNTSASFHRTMSPPREMAVGLLVGAAVTVSLLLLFSGVLVLTDFPHALIEHLSLLAAALGAFICSLYTTKRLRRQGLMLGFLCGGCYYFLLVLAAVCTGSIFAGGFHILKLIILLLVCAIGGVIGVNQRAKGEFRP